MDDFYYKLVNKIVELVERYSGIVLEDLIEIRDLIRYLVEVNGRFYCWSFRKF